MDPIIQGGDLIEKVTAYYMSAKTDSLIAAMKSGLESGMEELKKYVNKVKEMMVGVNDINVINAATMIIDQIEALGTPAQTYDNKSPLEAALLIAKDCCKIRDDVKLRGSSYDSDLSVLDELEKEGRAFGVVLYFDVLKRAIEKIRQDITTHYERGE